MAKETTGGGGEYFVELRVDNKNIRRDIKSLSKRMEKEFGTVAAAGGGRGAARGAGMGAGAGGISPMAFMMKSVGAAMIAGGMANMIADPYRTWVQKLVDVPLIGGFTNLLRGAGGLSLRQEANVDTTLQQQMQGMVDNMTQAGVRAGGTLESWEMMVRIAEMLERIARLGEKNNERLTDIITEARDRVDRNPGGGFSMGGATGGGGLWRGD